MTLDLTPTWFSIGCAVYPWWHILSDNRPIARLHLYGRMESARRRVFLANITHHCRIWRFRTAKLAS